MFSTAPNLFVPDQKMITFSKIIFWSGKKNLNHPKMFWDSGLTEREAAALERPRVGVGENYPLTIDENTTNVDSEPPECKTQ